MESNNLQKKIEGSYDYQPYKMSYTDNSMGYRVAEEEATILDYWRIFWRRKWFVLFVAVLFGVVALGLSLFLPKKYKTQATLMPLTSSGGGGLSSFTSQISSLPLVGSQLGGLGNLGGGKNKELVNILKSRTLTERVIDKFDLMKVLFEKQYDSNSGTYGPNWLGIIPVKEDAVKVFQKKVSNIEEDKKSGLVKIQVSLKDPVLAAKVANEMVSQLQSFIENNSLTLSKRNRIFIEQQLVKNGAKLLEAGKELNNFYANNRISSVIPQLDVSVGAFELLPKPFEEFNSELNSFEDKQGEIKEPLSDNKVRQVPGQIYLQFLTLKRELIARSHALLTQQYELAKIDESKEDLAFQIIDRADIKIRPAFPSLLITISIGIMGGFVAAAFLTFFFEYIRQLKSKESRRVG